jgi:hypothetical protein
MHIEFMDTVVMMFVVRRNMRRPGHEGPTQLTESPENPGRFRSRCHRPWPPSCSICWPRAAARCFGGVVGCVGVGVLHYHRHRLGRPELQPGLGAREAAGAGGRHPAAADARYAPHLGHAGPPGRQVGPVGGGSARTRRPGLHHPSGHSCQAAVAGSYVLRRLNRGL